MVHAWVVFYPHAWFGKPLSPKLLRAIVAEIPAGLGLIMGLAAIYENIYPPDPANKIYWILGFALISVFALATVVALRIREDARSNADREAQASRDALAAEQYKVTLRVEEQIGLILASNKTDAEKVENTKPYVASLKAFALVDEITRYLENNKLPRPRKAPPWILAAGGSIPPEQTPEATMARAFREQFGNRLRALVEQFKENGIKLPQKDEAYFDPHTYSWVRLAIDQIKEAANRLASNLEQANKPDEM
jgi:hypothetical protein